MYRRCLILASRQRWEDDFWISNKLILIGILKLINFYLKLNRINFINILFKSYINIMKTICKNNKNED